MGSAISCSFQNCIYAASLQECSLDEVVLNDFIHRLNLGVFNDTGDLQLLNAKAHRHQLGCTHMISISSGHLLCSTNAR